ncbi:hypothetical protein BDQ17DRAFT_1429099 [Cyathus striatus]|nr:hypothetical protein BDQ17DRAFT_1429099 [Cyathus striatus]
MGRKKMKISVKINNAPLTHSANPLWWMIQAIVSIPIPVIMMSQVLILFLASLGQTLTDGSSLVFVSFTHLLHPKLTLYVALAFIFSTAYNLTTFPFTSDAPIKVFFQQRVQVLPGGGMKAVTALTVVPFYLQIIIHKLPSTWRQPYRGYGTNEDMDGFLGNRPTPFNKLQGHGRCASIVQ